MNKAVAKKQTTDVVVGDSLDGWGNVQDIDQSNVIIPKILPMQSTSMLVVEGHAKMGEFRDSLSGKLLGSIDKEVEFIPISTEAKWIIFHDGKYHKEIAQTNYNKNWPIEDHIDGVHIKRVRCINVFAVLAEDIKTGMAMPYVISFRSTSYEGGKQVVTRIFQNVNLMKKNPSIYSMKLRAKRMSNDKGNWIVMTTAVGRRSTPEELDVCKNFHVMMQDQKVKVDESEFKKPTVDVPSF